MRDCQMKSTLFLKSAGKYCGHCPTLCNPSLFTEQCLRWAFSRQPLFSEILFDTKLKSDGIDREREFFSEITACDLDNGSFQYVLSGRKDGAITVHDTHETQCSDVRELKKFPIVSGKKGSHSPNRVRHVQWYPHDTSIFFASQKEQIVLYNTESMTNVMHVNTSGGSVEHFSASAFSSLLAFADFQGAVEIYDLRIGSNIHRLTLEQKSIPLYVQWHPSEQSLLASSYCNGSVMLWDIRSSKKQPLCCTSFDSNEPVREDCCKPDSRVMSLLLEPNTDVLFICFDRELIVHDLINNKPLQHIQPFVPVNHCLLDPHLQRFFTFGKSAIGTAFHFGLQRPILPGDRLPSSEIPNLCQGKLVRSVFHNKPNNLYRLSGSYEFRFYVPRTCTYTCAEYDEIETQAIIEAKKCSTENSTPNCQQSKRIYHCPGLPAEVNLSKPETRTNSSLNVSTVCSTATKSKKLIVNNEPLDIRISKKVKVDSTAVKKRAKIEGSSQEPLPRVTSKTERTVISDTNPSVLNKQFMGSASNAKRTVTSQAPGGGMPDEWSSDED